MIRYRVYFLRLLPALVAVVLLGLALPPLMPSRGRLLAAAGQSASAVDRASPRLRYIQQPRIRTTLLPPSARGPYGDGPVPGGPPPQPGTYSSNEILDAGHRFFGNVSEGLAKVVEHAFARNGRPNGYILGEEAGGAFVAGLRYGEGMLYTKGYPPQKVYWQGPSLGYDFGANGSKVMTLVYNLRNTSQIYERFAGVDGSAYFVGGVGITFQQHDDVMLAPIRAGLGLRLGANVGYLKYTPSPTWNPF